MTWDSITLESPSHDGSKTGTMIRLPTQAWRVRLQEAGDDETPRSGDRKQRKNDRGLNVRAVVIQQADITDQKAKDTDIWDSTIVNGSSVSALNAAEEFLDLLEDTRQDWWKESASGSWHNDSNAPDRKDGLARIRVGDEWGGSSLQPRFIYGYVKQLDYGPPRPAAKNKKQFTYTLEFREAPDLKGGS